MFAGTLLAFLLLVPSPVLAQRGGPPAGPPPAAQAAAPIDLTGYWESYVNEDWLLRMVTPRKGDYQTLPLNAEGRKAGDTWDPDKDTAAGLQCKSYGAAAVMRVPGRIHITWQDPNTLRIETEAGTQKRDPQAAIDLLILRDSEFGLPNSANAYVRSSQIVIPPRRDPEESAGHDREDGRSDARRCNPSSR